MAVGFRASADRVGRTANLPEYHASDTYGMWVKRVGSTGADQTIFNIQNTAGGSYVRVILTNGGSLILSYNGTTVVTMPSVPAVGTWFYLALKTDATGGNPWSNTLLYKELDGESWVSASASLSNFFFPAYMHVGGDTSGNYFYGDITEFRRWKENLLTTAELDSEMISSTPVDTTGILFAWPLATNSDTTDDSGYSYSPTFYGSPTTVDGPSFGGADSVVPNNITTGTPVVDSITILNADTTYTVDNANLFFSPGNWYKNGSSYADAVNGGAYIKGKFNGAGLVITIDASMISATRPGIVAWRIDGGSWSTQQLSVTNPLNITLASGLSVADHTFEFNYKSYSNPSAGRWTSPSSVLRVTSIKVLGGLLVAPTLKSKRWLFFGDSLTEGTNAIDANYQPTSTDGTTTAFRQLAEAHDAEAGIIGFVGQGWTTAGNGSVPVFHDGSGTQSWDKIYSGVTRSFSGIDAIFVNQGTNDPGNTEGDLNTIKSRVANFLTTFRSSNPNIPIYFVKLPGGSTTNVAKRDAIEAQLTASALSNTLFLPATDTTLSEALDWLPEGVANTYSTDGGHPNQAGHNYWFALLDPMFDHVLGSADVWTGAPVVDSASLGVIYSVSPVAITTGSPTVAVAPFSENQVLGATGITTGVPTVDVVTPGYMPGATGITTGIPVVDNLELTQVHVVTLSGITTGIPTVENAAASVLIVLSPNAITTGLPDVDAAKLNNIPRFRNATTNSSSTAGTTLTVNRPTYAEGDLIIAVMAGEVNAATFTPTIANWNTLWSVSPGTRALTFAGFWRRATASEPTTYSFTTASTEWVISAASYINAGNPYANSAQGNDSSTASLTAPSRTTTTDDDVVVFSGASMRGATNTPPTNFNERSDVRSGTGTTNLSLTIADRYFEGITTTGSIVGTLSAADYNAAGSIAFTTQAIVVAISPNNITGGTPVVDAATLSQRHNLLSPDITTPQPTIETLVISQNSAILLSDIMTGNPSVGNLTLSAILELEAIAPSIGPPTIDDLSLFQIHILNSVDITPSYPTLDNLEIFQNTAITLEDINTLSVIIENTSITEKNIFYAVVIESGTPVIDNATFIENNIFSINDVDTGLPVIDVADIGQIQNITCSDVVTGAIEIDGLALSQFHIISVSDIVTENPIVETVGMDGSINFTANNILSGLPALDNVVVAQAHSILLSDVESGAPLIGSGELTQRHSLTSIDIESEQPLIGALEVLQAHVLVLSGISTSAPVLGNLELLAGTTALPESILSGEPDVPPVVLIQSQILAAEDITTLPVLVGDTSIFITEVLAAQGISTQSPVVDSAVVEIKVWLNAQGITAEQPIFENPSIAQVSNLLVLDLVTGNPIVGNVSLGVANIFSPENIIAGQPVIENLDVLIKNSFIPVNITTAGVDISQITVSQHHNLLASTIETDEPTIENLRLNPGERFITRKTFSVVTDKREHSAQSGNKSFSVRSYEKIHNVK